jgi:hypothetical protein
MPLPAGVGPRHKAFARSVLVAPVDFGATWITAKQAATLLNLSQSQVLRRLRQGTLLGLRYASGWRLSRAYVASLNPKAG